MTVEVFGVEPHAAQLIWRRRRSNSDPATVAVHGQEYRLDSPDLVGSIDVAGLDPSTHYDVCVDNNPVTSFTTLTPPPGRLVGGIATISDLHIGERSFGVLFHQRHPTALHPQMCLDAALDEITTWAPDLVVVKGDLVHQPTHDNYSAVAQRLLGTGLAMLILPGNHDGGDHVGADPSATLGGHGVDLTTHVATHNVGGLTVIGGSTVRAGQARGTLKWVADDLVRTVGTTGPCLMALHHQLGRTRTLRYWPLGIRRAEAVGFLNRLYEANPNVVVTSGHTHRHRRRTHGSITVTEVGSTKDYPGSWAKYLVYEGGIVQTVRRIADPDVLRWTEQTAKVAGSAWGRWSPGTLADRCFSVAWC